MITHRSNISRSLLLAFAIAVGLIALVVFTRITVATAAAPASPRALEISKSAGTPLVTIFLRANTFTDRLPVRATELLTGSKGSAAARLAAQRNPSKKSDSESVAASIAENTRNSALPMIRAAAGPDLAVNDALQR